VRLYFIQFETGSAQFLRLVRIVCLFLRIQEICKGKDFRSHLGKNSLCPHNQLLKFSLVKMKSVHITYYVAKTAVFIQAF